MNSCDDLQYFNFASIVFELTDKCPIHCRSCLRSSSSRNGSVMSYEQVCSILDNLGSKGSFREVGFSGGECFLFPDLLLALCRYAYQEKGLPSVISTNGFWAKTPQVSRSTLKRFADNGLTALMVSVDDFHLEQLASSCIENCVKAALDQDVEVTLQVITTKHSRRIDELRRLLRLDDETEGVVWIENPCDPIGRAAAEVPENELEWHPYRHRGVCSILRLVSIRLDGSVCLCCGSGAEAAGLSLGNISTDSIDQIIERANRSAVVNLLAIDGGPLSLLEVLEKHGHPELARRQYTSPCDACYAVFSDPAVTQKLDELLQESWLSYYAMRIGWQTRLIDHLRELKQARVPI